MVRNRVAAGAQTAAAVALLGIPLGVLWWILAPRAQVTVVAGGSTLPFPLTESTFAMQGYYTVIVAGAGMLTGYCAYLLQYRRARRDAERTSAPPTDLRMACLVGLAAGAAAGSLLTWGTGALLGGGGFAQAVADASPGDVLTDHLHLDALGALVVWPFIAVLQYGLFDAVSIWRGDLPTDGTLVPADAPDAAPAFAGEAPRAGAPAPDARPGADASG